MGIYTPEVIAFAREQNITELQAYRHLKAKKWVEQHRRDETLILAIRD